MICHVASGKATTIRADTKECIQIRKVGVRKGGNRKECIKIGKAGR